MKLSVVIPVGPGDTLQVELVRSIQNEFSESEVIIACGEKSFHFPKTLTITSPWGRANQLNAGAGSASGEWLWFVHCDSTISDQAFKEVRQIIQGPQLGLHFFKISFGEGPFFIFLNAFLANIRAKYFGIPFGDQGFLIPKIIWNRHGYFPADGLHSEDHRWVWRLRKRGIPLLPESGKISTSARKYREFGWLRTSFRHFVMTWAIAIPQYLKLLKAKKNFNSSLAFFVKTPGISPVKTRLASSAGEKVARDFYKLSVESMLGLSEALLDGVDCYWAVAEAQGLRHDFWASLPKIFQGTGELGKRLHEVYSQLKNSHANVLLAGCDSPQLSKGLIKKACKALEKSPFVLGPAVDGGFYLFGGNQPLPKEFWNAIPYSQSNTAQILLEKLSAFGKCTLLPTQLDVDTSDDLMNLGREFKQLNFNRFGAKQRAALEAISGLAKT